MHEAPHRPLVHLQAALAQLDDQTAQGEAIPSKAHAKLSLGLAKAFM
jgi:hypothetical protein